MITVTFIRHGESMDNLRSVWAGWKDAPLSNHGMNQARAMGESFATTPYTAIYTSDLKRAHSTAQALLVAQTTVPLPPFIVEPDLREQNFGEAEGNAWSAASTGIDVQNKIYPVITNRVDSFPDGESLNDLAARAGRALDKCVVPWIFKSKGKKADETQIAIVSHGLCISELIGVLLKRAGSSDPPRMYTGLSNTAWTRLVVGARVRPL
ncbi:phosphoglycerate mutase-like protein [Sistotremastrum suecicum HHB10207 ss-3]|uniref:Phosphoglycerate mutase-like protein n=1 Tax=Sistotremastrum suecicum HHB10207 ss-3 TaxID=1314776 RepID=A0A165Y573_9AGAM|nr:phosphoglycerate mutase-like protein [Sistotremastrum suecicum HHB10207 ss-3]